MKQKMIVEVGIIDLSFNEIQGYLQSVVRCFSKQQGVYIIPNYTHNSIKITIITILNQGTDHQEYHTQYIGYSKEQLK